MTIIEETEPHKAFQGLTPDKVITLVENALNTRCTNLCRPMLSYINRVYELEGEDGTGLVAKFYRPGRWSKEALQDEHDFLLELEEYEVPVVAPLKLQNDRTLSNHNSIYFAIYPKKGGRSFDEYNDYQWLELGRLIARTHSVGAKHLPKDRITMAPENSTRQHVDYILNSNFIPPDLEDSFRSITDSLINEIKPLFNKVENIRIHGDCHFANLIYRPGESFYIIDFDDMAIGPPIQDLWMLLPGYLDESLVAVDTFLEGYETFRSFDKGTLRLIEPLRSMRYIHYTAWCAHQVAEDGQSGVAPDFGTHEYWHHEINDLADQLERIKAAPDHFGNYY